MKKIEYILPLALLPTIGLTPILTSCGQKVDVTLSGYTDSQTVGVDNKDYWVAAEPSATIRQTVVSGLQRVASVQELYGQDGFNQAVLVCKKGLLTSNPAYLNKIQACLQRNEEFIADESNSSYIKEFAGLPASATTQSLVNCNAKYIEQENDKNQYKSFLQKAKEVDSSVESPSSDDFYAGFPASSTTTAGNSYKIYYPAGAPAIAMANISKNKDSLGNTTTFTSIQSNISIYTQIIKDEPDLAILPSNLGGKLFNHSHETTEPYVWLSTVTWGNLYLLSKDSTLITRDNLKDKLYKKVVGVLQIASTPGIVFKSILKQNSIKY